MGDFKSYEITAADMKRITAKAGSFSDRIDWEAVRKAVREHRGYPVPVLDKRGAKGVHVVDTISVEDEKPKTTKDSKQKTSAKPVDEKPKKTNTTARSTKNFNQ